MEYTHPVDFESFYFIELIRTIREKGRTRFDGDVRERLLQFTDFMLQEEIPLQNIEKLAHIPGTSDVSIFFSDLMEHVNEYPPEEAVEKIGEHARDFLEIFEELVRDPEWEEEISEKLAVKPAQAAAEPETGQARPAAGPVYTFGEFIKADVRRHTLQRFSRSLEDREPELNQLFDRLDAMSDSGELADKYQKVEALKPLISVIGSLYQKPATYDELEQYFQAYFNEKEQMAEQVNLLAENEPETFAAFCAGEKIEVPSRKMAPEEEMEEMIENARKFDQRPRDSQELTEEERNLRWLLRDYIIHEIEELATELSRHMTKLSAVADDEDARTSVQELMKVLKDLGQIHKYPVIESVTGEILLSLQKFFDGKKALPEEAGDAFRKVTRQFIGYIDDVLSEKEEERLSRILEEKENFLQALTGQAPSTMTFSLADAEAIQPAFGEVNRRFIEALHSNLDNYLQDEEAPKSLENMDRQLQHLRNWYDLWELTAASRAAQLVLDWIEAEHTRPHLAEKQAEIRNVFDFLSRHLFSARKSDWDALFDGLGMEKEEPSGVGIDEALEAFQDVTLRRLRGMEKRLRDRSLRFDVVMSDDFYPELGQIKAGGRLLKNEALLSICDYFDAKKTEFAELEKGSRDDFRESLAEVLEILAQAIYSLPEKIPAGEIIGQWESMTEEGREPAFPEEEAEEKPAGETEEKKGREAFIDDELTHIFKEEAGKYLDEIESQLEKLEADKNDRTVLRRLGNVTHTLKGSAQMLNQEEISSLTRPLEDIVDLILDDKLRLVADFFSLYSDTVQAIRKVLKGEPVQTETVLKSQNDYVSEHLIAETGEVVPEEIAAEESAPEVLEEISRDESAESGETAPPAGQETGEPMVVLSETDPELLEIFSSEALTNLETFEKSITLIEKFTYDKKTLQRMDQSIHEVRAAAKMLGFAEIGNLLDGLEQLVELINKQEPQNWDEVLPVLRKAVNVVRDLTESREVSQQHYDESHDAVNRLVSRLQSGEEIEPAEIPAATTPPEAAPQVLEPSPQVKEAFIQEARDYLEDINFLLMKMEKNPENEELSYHLMRSLHTLKGSASMVYQAEVEKMTHLTEDLIEKFREKGETIPQKAVDLLFDVLDEIEFIVDALASGLPGKVRNYEEILEKLQGYREEVFQIPAEKAEETGTEAPSAETAAKEEPEEEFLSVTDRLEQEELKPRDAYVRLHVNQMDNLLNEAAELVINHTQFKTQLDKFKNYMPKMDMESKNLQNILWYLDTIEKEEQRIEELMKPYIDSAPAVRESQKNQIENIQRTIHNLKVFFDNFKESLQAIKESGKLYEEQVHKITRLSTQIHEEIMEARLVPIGILFQRFQRPLRDLARKYAKKISLYMEGESTELDRLLIEKMYEPLLHILRNAIDHGIETPEKRKAAGKSEEGLIKIIATQERNFVNIEIRDDGRGIDIGRVRKKAVELEYVTEDQVGELSDQEIFEFLMYPGFSTAESTTELSGRGVGLDVVKNQIQKIKGDIRINSEEGKGTAVQIRVPISLTVTQAMLVEVSGHAYAIPLMQVEETANVRIKELDLRDEVYYLRQRGGYMPVLYMANLLHTPGAKKRPVSMVGEYPVIIVQDEGSRVALLVDKIVHREEILIKSLGPNLQRVRFITGGSILADGKVVLVLDVPQIVKESIRMKRSGAALNPQDLVRPETGRSQDESVTAKTRRKKKILKDRKPMVLVVDDSLSIRKFLSGLLSHNGFEVEMAKNGYNALEKLNQQAFDLVVTDLEMPQLSGYELIEQIRNEKRWNELPIVVLTGRASKHIHQLTINLGADEFIIKPFKENELLDKIRGFVEFRQE